MNEGEIKKMISWMNIANLENKYLSTCKKEYEEDKAYKNFQDPEKEEKLIEQCWKDMEELDIDSDNGDNNEEESDD